MLTNGPLLINRDYNLQVLKHRQFGIYPLCDRLGHHNFKMYPLLTYKWLGFASLKYLSYFQICRKCCVFPQKALVDSNVFVTHVLRTRVRVVFQCSNRRGFVFCWMPHGIYMSSRTVSIWQPRPTAIWWHLIYLRYWNLIVDIAMYKYFICSASSMESKRASKTFQVKVTCQISQKVKLITEVHINFRRQTGKSKLFLLAFTIKLAFKKRYSLPLTLWKSVIQVLLLCILNEWKCVGNFPKAPKATQGVLIIKCRCTLGTFGIIFQTL